MPVDMSVAEHRQAEGPGTLVVGSPADMPAVDKQVVHSLADMPAEGNLGGK